jgi:hypothetical protein
MTARTATASIGILALAALHAQCGGSATPTAPSSQPPFPVVAESASFRYHSASGDNVDAVWQEAYHAWATARLGIQLPKKIDCHDPHFAPRVSFQ